MVLEERITRLFFSFLLKRHPFETDKLAMILGLILFISTLTFSQEECLECKLAPSPIVQEVEELQEIIVPPSPWEIPIVDVDYIKNEKASHCTRDPKIADTIVIHHSATDEFHSPQDINEIHTDKAWWMIAYNFAVNSDYAGESEPVVSRGRPLNYVGAHTGASVIPNQRQKEILKKTPGICERKGYKPRTNNPYSGTKVSANLTTVGIVVIGNYSPESATNISGYPVNEKRLLNPRTIEALAKLTCTLQKDNPNLKTIKWHNYFVKTTQCPGTVVEAIPEIIKKAKEMGCEFSS